VRPDLDDEAALLDQCEVDTLRASGPGGQKRNKTESAVRMRHKPSGIIVVANESRSQHDNRAVALQRMRKALALKLREPVNTQSIPEAISSGIDKKGRLKIGQKDARYIPAVAVALDVLAMHLGRVSDAAKQLGITTANYSSFLTEDEDVFVEANLIRIQNGQGALRRRE
jgi:hypothetical protein